MKKIICAKCDKKFKENGCIHVWSADYPDISKNIFTFSNNINDLTTRMGIISAAREIEDRVRGKDDELLFEIHLCGSNKCS